MSWLCVAKKKPPPPAALETCDCSHLNLVELPREVLDHMKAIRSLNLNSNAVKDIPKAIYQMENLQDLDISENEVIFLSPSISQLSFLTTLTLSKNSLSNIPEAIKECHALLSLNLSNNPLGELCDGVMELRLLRKLILTDTQMEELPPNIGKLEKLEVLDLRENMLQTLPSSICHLTLLERLDLGTNEFVHLPHVISSLESLSELWLDTNIISVLPEDIGQLHNLRFLELSENHLMLLPDSIGGWSNLTHLYLSDNLISLVPSAIENLGKLSVLKLDHNRLGGLPDTLDGLYNVTELSFSHNHLSELPPSIGGMTSLVDFNVDDNLLTELPPEIGQCSSLTILSVCNNQLVELPIAISSLSSLSILSLTGNQLQHLPYGLTKLSNISAIWIAGNQNRPIVDLQLIRDERGEKCLTCYLLPQQGHEPPFVEGGSLTDSMEGSEEPVLNKRASQVNFDIKVPDKPKATTINRDPTPYPKELHAKAMQWRAARQAAVGGAKAQSEVDVTRRHASGKRLLNRNSLLTALANPIDDNLFPASDSGQKPSGRKLGRQTRSSSREATPHPPTIPEGVELATNKATHKLNVPVSPTSKTSQTSNSISQLPLPYSPEGSATHSVLSGPYLDPPKEFAPGIPRNGNGNVPGGLGIRHDAAQVSEDVNGYENLPAPDLQQPMYLVANNGNSNNSNNNGRGNMKVTYSSVAGMIRTIDHIGKVEHFSQHEPALYTHHLQSSAESGFLADNESSQPWYVSPQGSPKSSRRSQGGVASSTSGQRRGNREYAQLSNNLAKTTPSQESAQRMTGYDHLMGRKIRSGKPVDNVSMSANKVGVVSNAGGVATGSYHHSGSRSFDTAETLGSRVVEKEGNKPHKGSGFTPCSADDHTHSHTARSLPPQGRMLAQQNYHRLEREPLSVVSRLHVPAHQHDPLPNMHLGDPLPTPHQHDPLPTAHFITAHQLDGVISQASSQATPFQSHSQPEAVLGVSSLTPPPDPYSQPPHHSRGSKPKRSGHVTSSTHRHTQSGQRGDPQQRRSSKNRSSKAKHVLSSESIFQSPPGDWETPTSRANDIHDIRSHDGHGSLISAQPRALSQWARVSSGSSPSSGCHRQQLSLDESHLYTNLREAALLMSSNEESQVSGQETTPTIERKAHSSSGHDSGFEGMKKDTPYVQVVLKKAPSLGFGITGGRDGVNVINPGDKGFYIHKLLEGLPAHRSGKVSVGDQLVEVNGIAVSPLTTPELLALLTRPEKTFTLLLRRRPSLTLL